MKLLEKAKDKGFWAGVRESDCFKKYRDELLSLWEKHCTSPREVLTYSDFKLFWDTGDRKIYESKYFSRRLAISASALLSLIYPDEEKYLLRLMDEIYAVCDEYTWCLPAHQKVLDVNNNSKIDLFASETGFALSEICEMLGDRLDPLIKNRIDAELERRIFSPFLAVDDYGWWETGKTNWTAVCICSVAGAFMLRRPEAARELIPRFQKAMRSYLSGFEDDGICVEGCGYWGYGFGFFTVYADMLKRFTDGELDWFKDEKVRSIATFIQKMFLSENACVSFSDGGAALRYHLGLCHYLKSLYPDAVKVYSPEFSYNYDGCARFCLHLRAALWLDEKLYYSSDAESQSAEYYAENSQWFIKRTSAYGFAAKGGHNSEPHNHNDVGSFIFAKCGKQLLADLGSGVYTRQYFDKNTRYDILECSSRSHSLPMIDGKYQSFGRERAARDVKYEDGIFSLDLAPAYECEELTTLRRAFSFTENSVTLSDEFEYSGDGEIVERLVSLFEPKINEDTVTIEDATVEFDPNTCTPSISYEEREKGDRCYFIDFKLKSGVRRFECTLS